MTKIAARHFSCRSAWMSNVSENNSVRAIDAYVKSLDLVNLEFLKSDAVLSAGQPAYHPSLLLKLYPMAI